MSGDSRQENQRIEILDPLRGLAAISVCIFHFVCGSDSYLPKEDPLRMLASFGHLGVPVFFVISGFVICYSLGRRDYRLSDAPGFLCRRLKRLEPPYLMAIVLSISLTMIASKVPGFKGDSPTYTFGQLAAHVGYWVDIAGFTWVNPVFWTLALEFQFYLMMAAIFPVVNSGSKSRTSLCVIALSLSVFFAFGLRSVVVFWMPLFCIGITCWASLTNRLNLVASVTCYTAAAALVAYGIGLQSAIAGLCTAAIITLFRGSRLPEVFWLPAWLGSMSYSLYLLHVPFGTRITNLALRLPAEPWLRYSGVAAATMLTVIVSWIFWRLVEMPSAKWSQMAANGRPTAETKAPLSAN